MKIFLKTINLETMEPNSVLNFISELSDAYSPVLFSIRSEYWQRLNLPQGNFNSWWTEITSETLDEEGIFGDLIMTEGKNILYYKADVIEKKIEIGFIGKKEENEAFSVFSDDVIGCVRRNFNTNPEGWIESKYDESILKAIEDSSSVCVPTEEEDELSIILEDSKRRDFLHKIKDCVSTSIAKLVSPEELPKVAKIVDIFEKRKVLTKDFVVLCSKTGQPILKVSSRSALEGTQGANKCFICGNPLSQEKIDEIVTCSRMGKNFIENGYWLQIRIMHALKKCGIAPEQTRVWNGNNDIRYLFSIINGQSFMFVLSDNRLTIEDMYKINLYISSYDIKNVLLISTEKIPLIIKKYTQNSNKDDVSFDFIETIESIDEAIELFIIDRCSAYISRILSSFTSFTPVRLNKLVIDSITNKEPARKSKKAAPKTEEPKTEEKPVEPKAEEKPEEPKTEEKPEEQKAEEKPEEPLEEPKVLTEKDEDDLLEEAIDEMMIS